MKNFLYSLMLMTALNVGALCGAAQSPEAERESGELEAGEASLYSSSSSSAAAAAAMQNKTRASSTAAQAATKGGVARSVLNALLLSSSAQQNQSWNIHVGELDGKVEKFTLKQSTVALAKRTIELQNPTWLLYPNFHLYPLDSTYRIANNNVANQDGEAPLYRMLFNTSKQLTNEDLKNKSEVYAIALQSDTQKEMVEQIQQSWIETFVGTGEAVLCVADLAAAKKKAESEKAARNKAVAQTAAALKQAQDNLAQSERALTAETDEADVWVKRMREIGATPAATAPSAAALAASAAEVDRLRVKPKTFSSTTGSISK